MTRKLIVGALAAVLLTSGALVGVSFGGGGGINQPEVIELSVDICGNKGQCRFYPLRELGGHRTGQVSLSKNPLFDVNGDKVGRLNASCTVATGVNWVCTYVLTLKTGQHTERGTVVTTGIYASPANPDVFAVTGGTEAYENVRGFATFEDGPGRDPFILQLTP